MNLQSYTETNLICAACPFIAAELKKIRPNIPVVLCTGFSYQVNEEKSKALGIDGFVMKPVIMKEIAATIRKVLDNTTV